MNKEELIEKLEAIEKQSGDVEENHVRADDLLILFINDEDIKRAFDKIDKWYA